MWAQPCLLSAEVGGVQRRHVPDYLFATAGGVVTVVNVKPADRLRDPKIVAALAWLGAVFRAHGWGYEVWSGELRTVVENVRFLAGYRRPGLVEQAYLDRLCSQVVHAEALGDLERRLAAGSPVWTVRPVLLALLWQRRLETDLRVPLSADSIVWRSR